MICDFAEPVKLEDGRYRHECSRCYVVHVTTARRLVRVCKVAEIPHGPGTELKALLQSLGITEKLGCGCASLVRAMDRLGVEGCRADRDDLADRLRRGAEDYHWSEKARAAAKAVRAGLLLNPLDVFGGLVDRAIELAEQKP